MSIVVNSKDTLSINPFIENSDRLFSRPKSAKPGCLSTRFKIASMSMLACVVLFITRLNLHVAIDYMSTQPATDATANSTNATSYCHTSLKINRTRPTINSNLVSSTTPEFQWSMGTQIIILSSFYYSFVFFQIIGSRMAELFGAKWICGLGILISGLINLATPILARTSLYMFIGSRIVLGLAQSAVFPSFYALFTKWLPNQERSNYLPWLHFGSVLGKGMTNAATGVIIDSGFFGGWPLVFYISGFLAIAWSIGWIIYARSDPSESPFISQQELDFIIDNTDETVLSKKKSKDKPSVPWMQILTSKAFIGVLIAKLSLDFTYNLLLTQLPILQNIIDVPIDQNGSINSYLDIGIGFTLSTAGHLATLMLQKTGLSTTAVRKIFESAYGLLLTSCLILIPMTKCNHSIVIVLLFIASASTGLSSGGDIPIVTEMTSLFPATVFSIISTFKTLTGFVGHWIIEHIINSDPFNMVLWSHVFYFAAGLSLVGTLTFVLLAEAKKQPWDCPNQETCVTRL